MSLLNGNGVLLRVALLASTAGACSSPESPAEPGVAVSSNGGGAGNAGAAAVGFSGSSAASGGRGGAASPEADSAGGASGGVSGRGGMSGTASGTGGLGGGGKGGEAGTGGAVSSNAVSVFLLAGQSNATGQGYTKNYPTGFTIDPRVVLYHSAEVTSATGGNVWGALRHASEEPDGCGDRFGPELGFGNEIQALYPGRRIAIIKHAKSATNLASQWAPGNGPADAAHFGPEFRTFVATVDSGMKALTEQGLEPKIVGMLWQQGEADADLGGPASADYGQHLSGLIARAREQWSVPDMLFVYGFVYPKSNYGAGRDQVRAAQAKVDQDSGDLLAVHNAFVVGTDDLELRANDPNTCYASDLIHFGTAGQLELGKRFAVKVHEHLALL